MNLFIEGAGLEPPADDAAARVVTDLGQLLREGARFGTIYADPPWRYDKRVGRGAVGGRYDTMALEDIAALPVGELAAAKSHLHLWATDSFLGPAVELLRGWGFSFEGSVVWVKPQLGTGNYWRSSHEYMLLGIRGGLAFPEGFAARSWVGADRLRHSEKPEAFRSLVEQVSPGPRLEMFGRKLAPGWVVYGNQIGRGVLDPPLARADAEGDTP